jgi:hypothetical protein
VLTCVDSLSQARLRLASGTEHTIWLDPSEIIALTRLVAARTRETAARLTDSRPKTHPEFRPADASRCHSLPLAGQAIVGADLHEWLSLLVTA